MYYKSSARWQKNNTKIFNMRLNNYADLDIIKFLDTVENKQGLVKELIRAEMEKRGFVCPHPTKKEVDAYEEYLCDLEFGEIGEDEDFNNETEE